MHPECVEEKARILMSRLGPTLGMHGGILAGGTGLALHLGHRIGVDLEFFSRKPFKTSEVLEELRALAGIVEPKAMDERGLIVEADGARLSLVQSPEHFRESTTRVNGCDVAGVMDTAAMKLVALARGGIRADFVDLYAVLQAIPFRKVAHSALEQYGTIVMEPLVIGKGLVWFRDADNQGDPVYVGTPVAWNYVKEFFRSSLRQFVFDLDAERQTLEQN